MTPIEERIQELLALPDGWYNGEEGRVVTNNAGFVALEMIRELSELPRIFPTLSGGIQLEWSAVEIEIHRDGSANIYVDMEEVNAD